MQVRYRHVFTVVVEDSGNFSDAETLARIQRGAESSARTFTMLVKQGGTDPKPVRSSVLTTSHVTIESGEEKQ